MIPASSGQPANDRQIAQVPNSLSNRESPRKNSEHDPQPQEKAKKRPLPAFLAKNEGKGSKNKAQASCNQKNKVAAEVEVEPLSMQKKQEIDSIVQQMAALTLKAHPPQSQPANLSNPEAAVMEDEILAQESKMDISLHLNHHGWEGIAAFDANASSLIQAASVVPPESTIVEVSNHSLNEQEALKKRAKDEIPSLPSESPAAADFRPELELPALDESTIAEIKPVDAFADEPSMIKDAIELTSAINEQSEGGTRELDTAFVQSRSLSDNTRELAATESRIVMPAYPRFAKKKILKAAEESKADSAAAEEESKEAVEGEYSVEQPQDKGQRYFKDDSVLYERSSIRERRRRHAQLIEEKKIPQGKERTQVVYVAVPQKEDRAQIVMEEFEFQLDSEGTHYEYQFGKTKLRIFDWRKYQKMLRRFKQQAFQKGGDPNEQAKIKTAKPVETYERPEPWCSLEDYPQLLDVFDRSIFVEEQFVEKMLTLYKPRATDGVGYVYVLQRKTDMLKYREGVIDHILLHKIGMTCKEPQTRVNQQSRANGEEYHILAWFKSSFHKYFEYACHRYFQDCRVVKCDSKDGGTEWFLIEPQKLLPAVQKIRQALYYMFNDKHGWKPPVAEDDKQ